MRTLVSLLLILVSTAAIAKDIKGKAKVADGDTIKIGKHQIILEGIDAPEHDQTCKKNGKELACGAYATLFLANLIDEKEVRCEIIDRDRYGRKLGTCYSSTGVNLNEKMVAEGAAIAWLYYSDKYKAQQETAKAEKRGIWASEFMEPYEWRRHKRRKD